MYKDRLADTQRALFLWIGRPASIFMKDHLYRPSNWHWAHAKFASNNMSIKELVIFYNQLFPDSSITGPTFPLKALQYIQDDGYRLDHIKSLLRMCKRINK